MAYSAASASSGSLDRCASSMSGTTSSRSVSGNDSSSSSLRQGLVCRCSCVQAASAALPPEHCHAWASLAIDHRSAAAALRLGRNCRVSSPRVSCAAAAAILTPQRVHYWRSGPTYSKCFRTRQRRFATIRSSSVVKSSKQCNTSGLWISTLMHVASQARNTAWLQITLAGSTQTLKGVADSIDRRPNRKIFCFDQTLFTEHQSSVGYRCKTQTSCGV